MYCLARAVLSAEETCPGRHRRVSTLRTALGYLGTYLGAIRIIYIRSFVALCVCHTPRITIEAIIPTQSPLN